MDLKHRTGLLGQYNMNWVPGNDPKSKGCRCFYLLHYLPSSDWSIKYMATAINFIRIKAGKTGSLIYFTLFVVAAYLMTGSTFNNTVGISSSPLRWSSLSPSSLFSPSVPLLPHHQTTTCVIIVVVCLKLLLKNEVPRRISLVLAFFFFFLFNYLSAY